jgi:hypothetical protein
MLNARTNQEVILMNVSKVEVWAGDIRDKPGGLDRVLGPISDAGGNLECVIARRDPNKPGSGDVFLTPIKGAKLKKAAETAGFKAVTDVTTLRVEGSDAPGLGHRIVRAVADAGVNMRGLSAAVVGRNFVAYLGFDSKDDADKAARAIKGIAKTPPRKSSGRK